MLFIAYILNTAVQWNLLLYNPAERVKPPHVERNEIKSLNDDEVMEMLTLLESEPLKYQSAIYVAVFGGLRLGEVVALKWTDIDFDTGRLSITKAGQYLKELGNFEKSPKNKSSKRELKLPDIALQKLMAWKREQTLERFKLGNEWYNGNNIFTQWDGTPVFYSTISHWFTKWLTKTDLPQITFHGLRHPYVKPTLKIFYAKELQASLYTRTPDISTIRVWVYSSRVKSESNQAELIFFLHPTIFQ